MSHIFRAGQMVRLARAIRNRNAAEGSYEVVRQLPYGEGEFQYRIKSAREQHERVVKESELERGLNSASVSTSRQRIMPAQGGSLCRSQIPATFNGVNVLQVLVRDNNVDQALRVLKKKMQREGVFREMKRRKFYEKPSEKSRAGEGRGGAPRAQARPQEGDPGRLDRRSEKEAGRSQKRPRRRHGRTSGWRAVTQMRIYIFKSEAVGHLRAFAGDREGERLPSQFRPWHAIGVVAADRDPPHKLPRDTIEQAIKNEGFQLWRMKSEPTGARKGGEPGS